MVRSFEDRPVPREIIDRMLANAVRAPSAGFSQGWAFLVLEDEERDLFHEVTFPEERRENFRWRVGKGPVLIVCLSHMDAYLDRYAEADKGWTDRDPGRWPVPYWHIDTGFAALLMLLTAVDEGLGALFFGIVPSRIPAFREAFGVPGPYTPIGVVAVGYPAPDEPSPSLARGRRKVEDVVHWGKW
jgi:nitroreductase